MKHKKVKVAVIGCGMISSQYMKNLKGFDITELYACSDIVPERAEKRAEEFGIKAMTNEEIFADPEIEMIVNTTYPLSHYTVAKQALLSGKSVYSEKMICETVEQATELMELAEEKGLFFGGATDTFLDASSQLARRIIDAGLIGTPTMVQAFLSRSYHHERHYKGSEKRFAFCRHGGIIFDMGGYYLSELVFLLGGIKEVSGFAEIRDPDRKYLNPACPLYGEDMTVESWNNVTGSLKFRSGALGTVTMTSEGGASANRFVIHGTDGMIDLGDPNNFESSVKLYNKAGQESVISAPFGFGSGALRGLGVADALYALKNGRAPRCSGELTRHVLEAALGICESSMTGKTYVMKTDCERPAPFEAGHTEYPELEFNV